MLKSFPVNGSSQKINDEKNIEKTSEKSQNIANIQIKQVISAEIQEVKQDLFKENAQVDNLKLLGDLLKFLRQSKSMSLLMLCRQISKIEVKDKVAVIYSDDDSISELTNNEKYKLELDEFFKSLGLSFKLYEKQNTVSASDILNEMLGGKLVIKQ